MARARIYKSFRTANNAAEKLNAISTGHKFLVFPIDKIIDGKPTVIWLVGIRKNNDVLYLAKGKSLQFESIKNLTTGD